MTRGKAKTMQALRKITAPTFSYFNFNFNLKTDDDKGGGENNASS